MTGGPSIEAVRTSVRTFPTSMPEADGTLAWQAVTAVTVELVAGGQTGLGWTYSSPAAASAIDEHLTPVTCQHPALEVIPAWDAMRRATRNLGGKGLIAQAISAVDIARWDLAARLLDVPVAVLAGGRYRDAVPLYGSGGFTTLDERQLAEQVAGWQAVGATSMKIKIGEAWGAQPERDLRRVKQLRDLAGPAVELMVDANGAYRIGQARRVGAALDDLGVTWFEEPVSSEDRDALALLRHALQCDVAAGEYCSDPRDAMALLPAVDCLQLDATRCGGYTGFLRAASIAAAAGLDVSAHCAPALHTPIALAVPNLRHVEYFVDHTRLEPQLADGVAEARDGLLHPSDTAGHGLRLTDK